MRVKKVINNNILCVIDPKGNEMIVTGRGIGFKKKTGEFVDETIVEKTYRMEDKKEQRKLRELVQQIPIGDLELTEKLIGEIKKQIAQPLNESLLITLADHISFAIKRKNEGIEFSNPLEDAIVSYYPAEYQLGLYCLKVIEDSYGVKLNRAEASFIALHIVNAELNTHMSEIGDITKLIDGCIAQVEQYYGKRFDRESLVFGRFVVHLRYFAQRIFKNEMVQGETDEQGLAFQRMIAATCPKHYGCAQALEEYIKKEWNKELTEEELMYLTIHLKRIYESGKIE